MPPSWLSRLSIGQKLAVSFGLIVILLIGSFSATLVYLSRVNSYVDRHQRITIPGVVTASEMLRNLAEMQIYMHHLLEHQAAAEQATSLTTIADIERRTLTALDIYQTNHAARTHPVLYGMLQQHGRGDLADEESRTIVAIADGMSALHAQREDIATSGSRRTKPPAETESVYEKTAAGAYDHTSPDLSDLHANRRHLLIRLREMTDQFPLDDILRIRKTEQVFHSAAKYSGQSKRNCCGG